VLLLAAAYAGWRWGPVVFPRVEAWIEARAGSQEAAEEPSEAIAQETLDRFEAFRRSSGPGERLALGTTELRSVLRYRMPGVIPPGVSDPDVALRDGRVLISGRVAVASFPDLPALDGVLGFLPDTLTLEVEGSLIPLEQEERFLGLVVHRVEAARIPLPRRLIPELLEGLGREYVGGLPEDALSVPLPDGLERVYVLRDSLILVSER